MVGSPDVEAGDSTKRLGTRLAHEHPLTTGERFCSGAVVFRVCGSPSRPLSVPGPTTGLWSRRFAGASFWTAPADQESGRGNIAGPRRFTGAQGGLRRRGARLRHHRGETRRGLHACGRLSRLLSGAARRQDRARHRGRAGRHTKGRTLVVAHSHRRGRTGIRDADQDRRCVAFAAGVVHPGRFRSRSRTRPPGARVGRAWAEARRDRRGTVPAVFERRRRPR